LQGSLAQELHGEVSLDYAPTGVVYTIVMPVAGAQLAVLHG
jgi:hypothetical protein